MYIIDAKIFLLDLKLKITFLPKVFKTKIFFPPTINNYFLLAFFLEFLIKTPSA